ncbi:hypothetical protein K505DRAFT_363371 [Melanomma pulvis-pyrius CBS 109.77]|uniref:Uncharacterized protein n=1 Tax=Melanomma pulvis-pyrius CBS 109.77 TaxID=1314802 RepID=A0A6A6X6K0_9PLEO|nr:hypothetical protein K505DRAFT_363371 [Melanomma pulvis-pyrius CBS 109.77]
MKEKATPSKRTAESWSSRSPTAKKRKSVTSTPTKSQIGKHLEGLEATSKVDILAKEEFKNSKSASQLLEETAKGTVKENEKQMKVVANEVEEPTSQREARDRQSGEMEESSEVVVNTVEETEEIVGKFEQEQGSRPTTPRTPTPRLREGKSMRSMNEPPQFTRSSGEKKIGFISSSPRRQNMHYGQVQFSPLPGKPGPQSPSTFYSGGKCLRTHPEPQSLRSCQSVEEPQALEGYDAFSAEYSRRQSNASFHDLLSLAPYQQPFDAGFRGPSSPSASQGQQSQASGIHQLGTPNLAESATSTSYHKTPTGPPLTIHQFTMSSLDILLKNERLPFAAVFLTPTIDLLASKLFGIAITQNADLFSTWSLDIGAQWPTFKLRVLAAMNVLPVWWFFREQIVILLKANWQVDDAYTERQVQECMDLLKSKEELDPRN